MYSAGYFRWARECIRPEPSVFGGDPSVFGGHRCVFGGQFSAKPSVFGGNGVYSAGLECIRQQSVFGKIVGVYSAIHRKYHPNELREGSVFGGQSYTPSKFSRIW